MILYNIWFLWSLFKLWFQGSKILVDFNWWKKVSKSLVFAWLDISQNVRYLCSMAALKIVVILREKAKLIEIIIIHRIHSKLFTKKLIRMIIGLHYFFFRKSSKNQGFSGWFKTRNLSSAHQFKPHQLMNPFSTRSQASVIQNCGVWLILGASRSKKLCILINLWRASAAHHPIVIYA